MEKIINKETKLCISLAGRPGNYGTRFHNYLYQALGLDYIYKAFTTNNLAAAIGGIRALGICGSGISMPYKEVCIEFVDKLDSSACAIGSVNTVVNKNGNLKAYNTDYIAVQRLLNENRISPAIPFVLKGSGGMAKAVAGALHDQAFETGVILTRNPEKGKAFAKKYRYEWTADDTALASSGFKMLINATPIGMAGCYEEHALAFPKSLIEQADIIFDVVTTPVETPLISFARKFNKKVICGADIAKIQALEQFVLYTGIRPEDELVEEAAVFARSQ